MCGLAMGAGRWHFASMTETRGTQGGNPTPRRPKTMSAGELRRIAVAAEADPRTVKKEVAAPGSAKGMVGDRIRRALQQYAAQRQSGL